MFTRALIAFLLLPGMVAFAVPAAWLWYTGKRVIEYPLGLMTILIGCVGLLWCVRDFYLSGRGTLAPWSPPGKLVIVGLYRYSRNPMYISVLLILLGIAVSFSSLGLLIYMLIIAIAFHLRIIFGEEPWLARIHGREWENYSSHVPRWFW